MAIEAVPAEFKGQTLTPKQIAVWAQQAGFTGKDLETAVAVALAESGGRIDATNHNSNGSTDYGVWQINSIHADEFTKHPQWWSVENADMAHDIWAGAGNSWKPWTTYTSGAYNMYLAQASSAASGIDTGGFAGGGPDQTKDVTTIAGLDAISQTFSGIATALAAVAKWIGTPSNWERVGLVFIGGSLVIGSLVVIAGDKAAPLLKKIPLPV
jgi:hypothetical protein